MSPCKYSRHHSKAQLFCFSPCRIHLSRSSYTISFRCQTALGVRGTNATVVAMSAPRTSLSSNRKLSAWSWHWTSGTCLPPLPPLPWVDGMEFKALAQQQHVQLGGLHLFCLTLLHHHLQLPCHMRPLYHLPRAPARLQHPAPATDHPTTATWAPQQGKPPATTHKLKAQDTNRGTNPALWDLQAELIEGM